MPYKFRRICPICYRPDVSHLAVHLRNVHSLDVSQRKPYLRSAIISSDYRPYAYHTRPNELPALIQQKKQIVQRHLIPKRQEVTKKTGKDMTSEPYACFRFRHPFSLMVCGPSQSGKTHLVRQILERNHIEYGHNPKQRKIWWFYGQYQPIFKELKRTLGDKIHFCEGIPDIGDDLTELDPRYDNICVLDDLMDAAIESKIVSKLFTQGRHRNASVILLLQNCFPKGKHNTSISRNAQYLALFRSPADRRQIGIVAQTIFDQNRQTFMDLYNNITVKPFAYVLIDNKPDTPSNRQVIVDVFGECRAYPHINGMRTDLKHPDEPVEVAFKQDILHRDGEGPQIVNLSPSEWSRVESKFIYATQAYNPRSDCKIWRVYQCPAMRTHSYYPVVLKDFQGNLTYEYISKEYIWHELRFLRGDLDYEPYRKAMF